MDRSFGSGIYGLGQNILADDCVFTAAGNLSQAADLITQIRVDGDVDTLIVEAHFGIFALRAGNGDSGAGYVGDGFQGYGECLALPNPSRVPIVPVYSCHSRSWLSQSTLHPKCSRALPDVPALRRKWKRHLIWPGMMPDSQHVYEVRPRKDKRGIDLISDALPFGRLWYAGGQ
jgi:hypothetical protein